MLKNTEANPPLPLSTESWVQYTRVDSDLQKTKDKVKSELANCLGIEPADVEDESVLSEDFHMKSNDLTDFVEGLTASGFDTSKIDLTEIETFGDLIEALTARE